MTATEGTINPASRANPTETHPVVSPTTAILMIVSFEIIQCMPISELNATKHSKSDNSDGVHDVSTGISSTIAVSVDGTVVLSSDGNSGSVSSSSTSSISISEDGALAYKKLSGMLIKNVLYIFEKHSYKKY